MAPHPRLRVRPALLADARACQEIRIAAFRPGPMMRCIFPGDMSAAQYDTQLAGMRREIESGGQGASRCTVLVAELMPEGEDAAPNDGRESASDGAPDAVLPLAGTEGVAAGVAAASGAALPTGRPSAARLDYLRSPATGGTIVAFAKWHVYREERPEAEWNVKKWATVEDYGEGTNLAAADAFLGELRNMRQHHLRGRPNLTLALLATSPNHQRLGAGTTLVRWGTELADREGLPSWLEASPAGYAIYVRCGFTDVAVLDLDVTGRWGIQRTQAADWGVKNAVALAGEVPGEGWHRTVGMLRVPVPRTDA